MLGSLHSYLPRRDRLWDGRSEVQNKFQSGLFFKKKFSEWSCKFQIYCISFNLGGGVSPVKKVLAPSCVDLLQLNSLVLAN